MAIQNFTNSSLVSYTKISPNKTSNRTHIIDTITIHCVVGQCTVEALGALFADSSVSASSNYGIGYDGKIGMYVEEKDRSWCSSNSSNDDRAITIEVASDTTHPYAVKDVAYESLIILVADICKRNNIKKLRWKADKSLIGQVDKQNMTVHRWFANKACPGDYLYERHGDIAKRVNELLGVVEVNLEGAPSTGSDADNLKIWNYLLKEIKNPYGVAGLMGNLYAESALRSNNMEDSHQKKLGYNDQTYTEAVDDGGYDNFVTDSVGYGLAQWTYRTRKQALLNYAKEQGKTISDITMQLEFLINELKNLFKNVYSDLKNAESVKEASNSVLLKFERPADQSENMQNIRANYGLKFYELYADKTSTFIPKFELGQEVKLVKDATYYDGKEIPSWVFNMKLYVRAINGENITISTLASGAITGIVKEKNLIAYSAPTAKPEPVVPKPEPEKPVSHFAIGEEVTLVKGAKYTNGAELPAWLYNKPIYVRAINGNVITISYLKTGAITGNVDEKYLSKKIEYGVNPIKPDPVKQTLKVGDKVKLATDATYYNGQKIPAWVFKMPLYVRQISGENITISTLKIGPVTGIVNQKYIVKV